MGPLKLRYKLDSTASVDEARAILFWKKGKPESLPPTSDVSSLHVKRVHYQATAWKQAHYSEPHLPDPETLGWKKIADNKLQPLLITHEGYIVLYQCLWVHIEQCQYTFL